MTLTRSFLLTGALFASLLAVQLCTAGNGMAQVAKVPLTYPDTPAGLKMKLYQEATAKGDEALRDFLKVNYPKVDADGLMGELIQVRNQSGGFDSIAVDPRSTPTGIALKVKSRNSGKDYLQVMTVEPQPPHNITAIGLANDGYDIGPMLAKTR